MKRLLLATFFGVCMGGLCAYLTFGLMGRAFALVMLFWILLNRTVMGLVIGASGLRMHWGWHGILMGVVVGSTFSFFIYMDWNAGWRAWLTLIGNAVFGFLIELLTTVVCRAPAVRAPSRTNSAVVAAI